MLLFDRGTFSLLFIIRGLGESGEERRKDPFIHLVIYL